MQPNATESPLAPRAFKWTKPREQAAALVAEDRLTDVRIAAELQIHKVTLERWKQHPEFRERVAGLVAEFRERVRRHGIAIVENRVAALDDRWKRMQQIIAERAADPSMAHVPGGSTGMLVRQGKLVKVYEMPEPEKPPASVAEEAAGDEEAGDEETGAEADGQSYDMPDQELLIPTKQVQIVYEYVTDTALAKELRDHERQAAQELGQWLERTEVEHRDGGIIDALDSKLASLAARVGPPAVCEEPESPGS